MKKNALLCAAAAAILLLSGCGQQSAPAASSSSSAVSSAPAASNGTITPEEGAAILEAQLGTKDEDTGYLMSYGYEDTITLDGVEYYNYRVSWLVDNSHMSYLTNYLVSLDGKTIQEYVPEIEPVSTDLQSAADDVLLSMSAGDFASVASWVGDRGLTFTPYSYADPAVDRTVTAEELASFAGSDAVQVWGIYDGSGDPIELTAADYWARFVWNADYTQADTVTVNGIAQGGNSIENVAEAYPDDQYVEYHFDQIDPQYEGIDWCSLKLVFEPLDGGWQLVGIIHSEATF
jgi:hypothetical protein